MLAAPPPYRHRGPPSNRAARRFGALTLESLISPEVTSSVRGARGEHLPLTNKNASPDGESPPLVSLQPLVGGTFLTAFYLFSLPANSCVRPIPRSLGPISVKIPPRSWRGRAQPVSALPAPDRLAQFKSPSRSRRASADLTSGRGAGRRAHPGNRVMACLLISRLVCCPCPRGAYPAPVGRPSGLKAPEMKPGPACRRAAPPTRCLEGSEGNRNGSASWPCGARNPLVRQARRRVLGPQSGPQTDGAIPRLIPPCLFRLSGPRIHQGAVPPFSPEPRSGSSIAGAQAPRHPCRLFRPFPAPHSDRAATLFPRHLSVWENSEVARSPPGSVPRMADAAPSGAWMR